MQSASASLVVLPNELLYKIIGLLEIHDLQALSFVFRELRPLVDPILYATIEIRLFNDSIRSMRNANRVRPTEAQLQYAHNLVITSDQPYYPNNKPGPIKRHSWKDRMNLTTRFSRRPLADLSDVVSSLKSVTSVRWKAPLVNCSSDNELPKGAGLDFNSIFKILASLPSLNTFTFDVFYPHAIYLLKNTRLGLENLHSLKSLSLTGYAGQEFWGGIIDAVIQVVRNSPELEDLSLAFISGERGKLSLKSFLQSFPTTQPLTLKKLCLHTDLYTRSLQLDHTSGAHLKNLMALEVHYYPPSPHWQNVFRASNEGLWAVLAYHGIKLKHIDAPMTVELINYLQTYSGVEYLHLWSEFGNVGLNNDHGLAGRFHHVLQLHSTSLRVLNTSRAYQ